jgi:molecular chaperone Hsp33
MSDEAIAALWSEPGLRAVCAVTTDLSRHARGIERAHESSASLLAQALTAAQLLSALQLGKPSGRINFQIECDGPLRGLFADADGAGNVRGYAKNPWVDVRAESTPFRWRPALGNTGFLSVLRDLDSGEYFRSSVELVHFDLAQDLQRFFAQSEQVDSAVALDVAERPGEPLGVVTGLVVQRLPEGDTEALHRVRSVLASAAFRAELAAGPALAQSVGHLLPGVDVEITARLPLAYRCHCSKDRVMTALAALGRTELQDVLAKDGKADITCQFCATHYEVNRAELEGLLSGPPRD